MADNIAAALAELQTQLPRIKKGETARVKSDKGSYSYSYANLADVSARILPLLGKLGLSFTARPTLTASGFVLAYELLHVSGENRCGEYPLPTGGTPQTLGSAITYGRRYCLCAVTGVAPDDDDDDGAAAETAARQGPRNKDGSTRRRGVSEEDLDAQGVMTREQAKAHDALLKNEPGKATRGPVDDGVWETGEVATKNQLGLIRKLFNDCQRSAKEDMLRASQALVGRPDLESAAELTKAQASTLIDALKLAAENDDPQTALAELVSSVREQEMQP